MSLTELLTGKCKEDFQAYFHRKKSEEYDAINAMCEYYSQPYDEFTALPPSMQWGVLVDFADYVGIHLSVHGWLMFGYTIRKTRSRVTEGKILNTRTEARQSAIKEFNRLYNENN